MMNYSIEMTNMDKIIYHSIILERSPHDVFEFFTVNKHLEQWLTKEADVEPRVGGKFELFWVPEDKENDSTIGCKILAFQHDKFLNFEWKGPKMYKHFMNEANPLTNVVVFFIPCTNENSSTSCTDVYLIHSGWKDSAEWQEAKLWTGKNWDNAFERLKKYVSEL